ncbi:MAG: DUF420 domain-containing protein [Crocinitomicaceae bacterium]|nr:DUF420 domain-containing protein [Crocinitomicaceae bacterium]
MSQPKENKAIQRLIIVVSILIPFIVAGLFQVKIPGVNLSFLPPIYVSLNAVTSVLLVLALMAVKKKNINLHEKLMKISMFFTLLFLIGYVAYHITSDASVFGDSNHDGIRDTNEKLAIGNSLYVYLFFLITHIVLTPLITPLVLFTYLFTYQKNFTKHRKIGKIAWPVWFYISVSGVIIYLMNMPYYN